MARKRKNLEYEDINNEFEFPNLHKHQKEFATTRAPYPLNIGGMGSGKSLSFIIRALYLSTYTPYFGDLRGNVGAMGRLKRTDLLNTTASDFFEFVPERWIKSYSKDNYRVELINGSVIFFLPLEDEQKLKSMNLGWMGIEQIEEVKQRIWEEVALHRTRRTKTRYGAPVSINTCFQISNACGGWQKALWGDNEKRLDDPNENIRKLYNPDYLVIHSSTYDNKKNLPPNYIDRMIQYYGGRDTVRAKRNLEGDWHAIEGALFPKVSECFLEEDIYPSTVNKCIIGLDHGQSSQTAFVFIAEYKQPDGATKIHIYDEVVLDAEILGKTIDVYESISRLSEAMQYNAIKRYEKDFKNGLLITEQKEFEPVQFIAYDPSMKAKILRVDQTTAEYEIIDLYRRHAGEEGIKIGFIPGINSIEPAIDLVQTLVSSKRLMINPRCRGTKEELETITWDKNKHGKIKDSQDFHKFAALRYALSKSSVAIPNRRKKLTKRLQEEKLYTKPQKVRVVQFGDEIAAL
jgi:phage terminase large subunit